MKKKYLIMCSSIVVLLVIGIYFYIDINATSGKVIENSKDSSIINSNTISMMYETESGSGEYQAATESSWLQEGYVFNEELSSCENGSKLTWNEDTKQILLEANVSDKCYVYFDVYVEPTLSERCDGKTLSSCIVDELYTEDGENDLYYHDGVGSYENADQEAGDNSYRFAGANPNNFVCFGTDDTTCSNDNLYRIIGVFDSQVKLIKNASIGSYPWASSGDNTWNSSTKPSIRNILNTTYLNGLGSTWVNKIAIHNWKVGGVKYDYSFSYTVKQYYDLEVGSSSSSITDNMKIGLMYASDYGYAASNNYWTTALSSYPAASSSNWMFASIYEWTISGDINNSLNALYLTPGGGVSSSMSNRVSFPSNVRPCFYLESSVKYNGGSGTQSDPFRIKTDATGGGDTSDND